MSWPPSHPIGHSRSRDRYAVSGEFLLHSVQRSAIEKLGKDQVLQEHQSADPFFDHWWQHQHLHRALIFAGRVVVHRAHRPAVNQAGRNKIQPLGRPFADEASVAATVSAGPVGGLQTLFHHFEIFGQRAAHRLLG